jgi:hypothetical protein
MIKYTSNMPNHPAEPKAKDPVRLKSQDTQTLFAGATTLGKDEPLQADSPPVYVGTALRSAGRIPLGVGCAWVQRPGLGD